MSQAGIASIGAIPPPPPVPTSFVTDINSPAIPAANILDVIGGATTANNLNGIQTDGSSGGNILTIQLTNRATGAISTSDATPTNAITFSLGGTPSVFVFEGLIAAFDTTDTAGAGYFFTAAARTTGAAAILISAPQFDTEFEEAAMATADVNFTVSGNNVNVVVTGIVGKTIDWLAQFTYTRVA